MTARTPIKLLVLGGTTEAGALAGRVAAARIPAILSLAGRVARPAPQPLPVRIGGFGGAEGLAVWLRAEAITHVIDATHPFAATISANAVAACAATGTPLLVLSRPAWTRRPGDDWLCVADIPGAVAALDRPATRVFLAIGRMYLPAFAAHPQHHYLLRMVDAPTEPPPFPDCRIVVDRGPFTLDGDRALMRDHGSRIVVSKNAGGSGAVAKIDAARSLGAQVVMIDRPALPPRPEVSDIDAALEWLGHGTDLGV